MDQVEEKVKAFVTVTDRLALEQARQADRRIAEGDVRPLTGIPMQIKDNMSTKGIPTTCSSHMLESFVPPFDATVISRLYDEGAVMVGKGNMDEFAMGSSTESSSFFRTRNPWDLERVPGGSSGGPAAAVAAGECIYSLGSDTGGSIRQPAALCGVVGMKPTYGLVSRYGLVAFASSLDQIGPLTKDVTDCAIVMNAIAGHDPRDSTSVVYDAPDYTKALTTDLAGLRIGVPEEYFARGIQPGVENAVREAIRVLDGLGAQIGETSLPHTPYALAVYYIIAPSEASANLARYDGVKYGYSDKEAGSMWDGLERTRQQGFGPEVKRRIMLGTYAPIGGLLRCLLPEGPEGPDADKERVGRGLPTVRCAGHADFAVGRVQARRENSGPGPDVSKRRLHDARQHSWDSRNLRPCGNGGRAARRATDHGQTPGRRDAVPDRLCLRAGH